MKILKLIAVSCLCFLPLSSHAMAGEQAGVHAPYMFQNNVKSESFAQLLQAKSAGVHALADIYEHVFRFVSPNMLFDIHGLDESALRLACKGGHIFVVQSMLRSYNESISQQDFDLLKATLEEAWGEHYDSAMDVKEAFNFIKSRIH